MFYRAESAEPCTDVRGSGHHALMGARFFVMLDSQAEAEAWVAVLRTMGMEILGRPTDRLSHDGSWTVRAVSPDVRPQPARAAAS